MKSADAVGMEGWEMSVEGDDGDSTVGGEWDGPQRSRSQSEVDVGREGVAEVVVRREAVRRSITEGGWGGREGDRKVVEIKKLYFSVHLVPASFPNRV